ncbi:hypothetical protein DKM44_00700 [Deinococcus irradiatisoli]|uniref:Uncharacterized protein n=1 Tax=Deinococcus irradiatisoli TaxID=2202254 RepID=A0A2Z3JD22_9DEIO|nr:hypothetical protein [Deinococcus irradiatisoli]AWN21936.1 hypothetical protein DKM44_00700 [Deinococcus irradiatisoli]
MNEPTSAPHAALPGATPPALSLPGLPAALVLLVLAVTFTVDGALGKRADGLYLFIPLAAVLGTAINTMLVRGQLPRRMYGPLLGTAIPAVIGLSMLLHFSLDHLWLPALFVWLAFSRLLRPARRR